MDRYDFNNSAQDRLNKKCTQHKPILAYNHQQDFAAYRIQVRQKIQELLGFMPDYTKSDFTVVSNTKTDLYKEITLCVQTEDDSFLCKLIIPLLAKENSPVPVIICLQGHGACMELSLARIKTQKDNELLKDNIDFGLQAVKKGYAAFLIEMRGMGERRFDLSVDHNTNSCFRPAMAALMFGQTLTGLRVSDIRSAVSALINLNEKSVKTDNLILLGHSGGGTAAFYTTCLDERINTVVLSCSLCSFTGSILHTQHCSCNYIPSIFKYFDTSDMAAAIFPRRIICAAGIDDKLFLIEETEKTVSQINTMYHENGALSSCVLIKGNGGHTFFKDLVWTQIQEDISKNIRAYSNYDLTRRKQ